MSALWFPAILNSYWIAATVLPFVLRRCSQSFSRLVAYGGHVSSSTPPGTKRQAKKEGTIQGVLAIVSRFVDGIGSISVSRRGAFIGFYVIGTCVGTAALLHVLYFALTVPSTALALDRAGATGDEGPIVVPLTSLLVSSGERHSTIFDQGPRWGAVALHAVYVIHTTRRWYECLCVHKFRSSQEDKVSLFAAAAGASFYVAGPLSLSAVSSLVIESLIDSSRGASEGGSFRGATTYRYDSDALKGKVMLAGYVLLGFAFALAQQMTCQWEQYRHHKLLASLRSAATIRQSPAPTGGRSTGAVSGKQKMAPVARQRFPVGLWFQTVQEPHYMFEVLLYFWMAFAGSCLVLLTTVCHPSATPVMRVPLSAAAVVQCLPIWSAALFSLFNLGQTAEEKRQYWLRQVFQKNEQSSEDFPKYRLIPGVW